MASLTTITSPLKPYTTYSSISADTSVLHNMATQEEVNKLKDAVAARDRHVDELEDDIDFLNEERKTHEIDINMVSYRTGELERKMNDYQSKINGLEYTVNELQNHIRSHESLIEALRIQVKLLLEKIDLTNN